MLRTTLDWQELHCAGAGKGAFRASLASIWVETYSIQTYCLSLSALKNILKLVDVEAFFSSAVELKQLLLLKIPALPCVALVWTPTLVEQFIASSP